VDIIKTLKRGLAELFILSLLKEEDMYGYQLSAEIATRSDGAYQIKESSMYPTLYRLQDKGLISERIEQVGKRRTRKYYHFEPCAETYLDMAIKEYIFVNRVAFKLMKIDFREG